jgi:hypothetical protein
MTPDFVIAMTMRNRNAVSASFDVQRPIDRAGSAVRK